MLCNGEKMRLKGKRRYFGEEHGKEFRDNEEDKSNRNRD